MGSPPILIGLGAGLVSAVLFTSAATGSVLAMMLFYLAPLPSFIAGLGWGWMAAAMAALSGTAVAGAALGTKAALSYLVSLGLPIAVLTYLALLSRAATEPRRGDATALPQPQLEWYPPGRLVAWAALMAGALAGLSVPLLGGDVESYRAAIDDVVQNTILKRMGGAPEIDREALEAMLDVLAYALPAASAVIWLGVAVFNMWAAGRIVDYSGRALRPWPDISAMSYPNGMAIAFVAALLATFLPGLLGIIAVGFAGAFVLAYTLLGLAVLHVITRPMALRTLILTVIYLSILLFGWVGLVVAIVGVGDPIFRLRERARNKPLPPAGPGD